MVLNVVVDIDVGMYMCVSVMGTVHFFSNYFILTQYEHDMNNNEDDMNENLTGS